ncbi:MAG TPA: diacylglycerol kinase family protein [Rhodothermales bacterium]|nr:diacylglycerol kinase family protein [Rhodothermales bacterium]
MRYIAILNPAADHGRTGKRCPQVRAALRSVGLTDEIWQTTHPGHAVVLARQAATQADVVVAVGGDGTVHEVSRGLIESGCPVSLGVLPLGTGNDFVKMLGMPRRLDEAVQALKIARPQAVDYGRVRWYEGGQLHEQPFVNAVGAGFDAQAAIEASAFKGLPGITGYLVAVLRTLRRWQSPQVRIVGRSASDQEMTLLYEGPLLLVTVGNGISSGGMFRLTPQASITDGLLDVCLVQDVSKSRILQMMPHVIQGTHETAQEVHMNQINGLIISSATGLPVHADGEILAQQAPTIEIEVVSGGLSVLKPA